ncbi:unnamed protein product [Lymnaea stagnalis]|uniref:Ras-associating domain-containing protein n=1 Tax=Lymnaea stagnalis TaxID=6523 RepID=A0AAV2I1N8_LYMST
MELKVWVDGIQRVVCGANYNTTCQDVVLALAHAMGRTGRFTLVEKWRESERPLTPAECPLQSLHKWGEYAPEVKFYLIQAQKCNQIQQTHHKTQMLDGGKKDSFGDKLSPRLSKYPGNPTGYESLKRSSTFSGAHGTNYTPSTLASSMSAAVSSYYAHNQESYEPPSSSSMPAAGKVRRTTLRSIPNGDVQNIPSNSSSQRTLRYPPGPSQTPLSPQADPNRGDARELHPANLPASSFKYPGRDFGASHQYKTSQLPSTVQHLNTAPHPVPTQHAHAPLKQKSPSASVSHALQPSSQPSLMSSFQYSKSEANYPQQNSDNNLPQKLNSQTSHSHQPFSKNNTAHNNDRPLPQPRHPQAPQGGMEYENLNNNHKQHYPQPPQPRQRSKERLPAKLSEVSRQTHSSDTYDQHRSDTLDQQRSDPLDQLKSESHDSFYSMDGSISTHVIERHNFKKRHENKSTRDGSDNVISNRVTQGLTSRVDGYRYPIDDSEHPHKSATLERSVPQQRKSLPPASRSLSVSGPEQNQPLDNPALNSAVGHMRRSGEIGKLSFVESALMKHSKPATDGSKSGAKSSFASAVAHLRQHSAEGNLKPKTDPHVRQHSSDSSHTDTSFQPGQEYFKKDKPDHGEPFNNAQHHKHPHHNISPHDTATLSSHSQISSSRHGSAFTEISIKQGSSSSPSFAPVPYNLDQANFSHSGNIVRNMTPSGAESHSREASLEIEEYDLDQRFPDVYHHEGGLKPVTVEYSLESGSVMPAKSEAEYLQLVRLVKMQQEKLEMQEAQINDSSTEISALEKQGSVDEGTLEVIVAEMSQLEKQESDWNLELDNLERVEWVNVLDGERKMEAKIKTQMSKLKEEINQIEIKLKELRAEEERLTREGQVEQDKVAAKKSKAEEADKETSTRMGKLNNKLAILGKTIKENEAKLKDLESLISKTEEMLYNQKKQVEAMEEEVKFEEVVQETQDQPLSEDSTSPDNQITASQHSNRAASLSASDSGEAILKILEGRLSPHPYPDSLSSDPMTSAGQKFKSQLAAKNPNGVWV